MENKSHGKNPQSNKQQQQADDRQSKNPSHQKSGGQMGGKSSRNSGVSSDRKSR